MVGKGYDGGKQCAKGSWGDPEVQREFGIVRWKWKGWLVLQNLTCARVEPTVHYDWT